jgi:hypothetical protein
METGSRIVTFSYTGFFAARLFLPTICVSSNTSATPSKVLLRTIDLPWGVLQA